MANRSDDFDRANGAIGNPSDGGTAWVVGAGTWSVSSNTAVETSGNAAKVCYLEGSSADGDVQAVCTTIGANGAGLMFRYTDTSNYWYLRVLGASLAVVKREAGTETVVDSVTRTINNGDTLKVTMSGNDLTFFHNGSQVTDINVTNTFNNTATKHGMSRPSGFSSLAWDNWSFADASAAPLAAGVLTVSGAAAAEIDLAVTAATGGTSPYEYQLQRADDVSGSPDTYANQGAALTGQTSSATFNDSTVVAGAWYWYRVVVTDDAGSPATENSNAVRVRAVAPANVVFHGNSMTAGTGATAPDKYYPARVAARLGSANFAVTNAGVGGRVLDAASGDDLMTDLAGTSIGGGSPDIPALFDATASANILVMMEGTNTIIIQGETDPDVIATRYQAYTTAAVADGWQVILVTIPPAEDLDAPTFLDIRGPANSLIAESWRAWGASGCVHLGMDQLLGADGSEDGPYYTDKIHMSDAGQDALAAMVAPVVLEVAYPGGTAPGGSSGINRAAMPSGLSAMG